MLASLALLLIAEVGFALWGLCQTGAWDGIAVCSAARLAAALKGRCPRAAVPSPASEASEALRREPLLRNCKSIASGLRAWHSFAVWV